MWVMSHVQRQESAAEGLTMKGAKRGDMSPVAERYGGRGGEGWLLRGYWGKVVVAVSLVCDTSLHLHAVKSNINIYLVLP